MARLNHPPTPHRLPRLWWSLRLALPQQQELAGAPGSRRPVFAVFPTVSTRALFNPLLPLHGARWVTPKTYGAGARAQSRTVSTISSDTSPITGSSTRSARHQR